MKSLAETNSVISHLKPAETVLSVRHLTKYFGDHLVLSDFNMDMKKGETIVVLGKSGSGKSVLIKCIIGLLRPDKGEIRMLGANIPNLEDEDLDKVRSKVGFLFQSNALYDSMTVRENLEFPLRRHWIKVTQDEIDSMVTEALENVDLLETIDMMPIDLSGGMKKRIALARTLILKPEIILYDEPTTGLDPITAKEIIELIIKIQKKYSTSSLIISHDMTCVRLTSDRILMLIEGRCYAEGAFEELQKSHDPKVKQFFNQLI